MASANGRLLASELATIPGTNQKIRKDLLPQIVAFMGAFKARFGRNLRITDGYRTYEQQVAVKALKGWLAATPGTSNHGWGTALDLGSGIEASFSSPEHLWARANGPAFGLFLPTWARQGGSKPEQWHFEFSSGVVPVSNYQSIPGAVPNIPGVDPLDPLNPTGELIMDAEARAAFDNLNHYAEAIKALITARASNLDLYAEAIKALIADVRGAVQVTTDNAYSGATISQTVLNSITDPTRGLGVQLANLAAQVAVLQANGATPGDVDVEAVANAAAREAMRDLSDALKASLNEPEGN